MLSEGIVKLVNLIVRLSNFHVHCDEDVFGLQGVTSQFERILQLARRHLALSIISNAVFRRWPFAA
jgi:hypothetical protein